MRGTVIVLLGVLLIGVLILIWMNRASGAVAGAALPAVTGLLSALALVFFFNRPEPIVRSFPVVFVIERATYLPITIPYRPFPSMSLALPVMMRAKNPTFFVPSIDNEFTANVSLLY